MAVTAKAGGVWAKDSPVPPWFKPDLFLAPDFDAEAAIRDMRRFVRLATAEVGLLKPCSISVRCMQVPLEALGAELEAQLGRLKAKVPCTSHLNSAVLWQPHHLT